MRASLILWCTFAGVVGAVAILLVRACAVTLPLSWAADFCPSLPSTLSTELHRQNELLRELATLRRQLANNERACASVPKPPPPPLVLPQQASAPRPQQTAQLKPPPPPPKPADLPKDRWDAKDLSVLEGCWTLGRETVSDHGERDGSHSLCRVLAGRICFGNDGRGTRSFQQICPPGSGGSGACAAAITARFDGAGNLKTQQPRVSCTNFFWNSEPNALTCRRVSDSVANCRDGQGFDLEFRR